MQVVTHWASARARRCGRGRGGGRGLLQVLARVRVVARVLLYGRGGQGARREVCLVLLKFHAARFTFTHTHTHTHTRGWQNSQLVRWCTAARSDATSTVRTKPIARNGRRQRCRASWSSSVCQAHFFLYIFQEFSKYCTIELDSVWIIDSFSTNICKFWIENAYDCDPRVARFKEIEKQRRLEEKQARAAAARKRAEEELKVG